MEKRQLSFLDRNPILKDALSLVFFVVCVILGTLIVNNFIFRSYNVIGISMENTFKDGDRVIVNRLTVSMSHFAGQEYIPNRGQIIVFANGSTSGPLTCGAEAGIADQYVIKRVVGFPGERVTVKDGVLTVYNDEHPDGFHPDDETRVSDEDGPKAFTAGEVDTIVPAGELFVAGDNREGTHSNDSRYKLGTIPYCRVVGPVMLRLFPLNKLRFFAEIPKIDLLETTADTLNLSAGTNLVIKRD
ncbi:MAG: signal peptidase I [Candidatus Saccharibacteria bacterium]|nr:signal peptidase I [Candidatus Saccharibacteria bacterium]